MTTWFFDWTLFLFPVGKQVDLDHLSPILLMGADTGQRLRPDFFQVFGRERLLIEGTFRKGIGDLDLHV